MSSFLIGCSEKKEENTQIRDFLDKVKSHKVEEIWYQIVKTRVYLNHEEIVVFNGTLKEVPDIIENGIVYFTETVSTQYVMEVYRSNVFNGAYIIDAHYTCTYKDGIMEYIDHTKNEGPKYQKADRQKWMSTSILKLWTDERYTSFDEQNRTSSFTGKWGFIDIEVDENYYILNYNYIPDLFIFDDEGTYRTMINTTKIDPFDIQFMEEEFTFETEDILNERISIN